MKIKLTILILTIGLTSLAFTSRNGCTTDAQIVGFSALKCGGCWGVLIKIGDETYIAKTLPKGTTYTPSKKWDTKELESPINIKINYELDSTYRDNINVSCLEFLME